ncbi:hypothetical protein LINPERHAP1_LOCUS28665 [Linum perenne]
MVPGFRRGRSDKENPLVGSPSQAPDSPF